MIAAANKIVGKPYKYGGGHGEWEDSGYDCSGSESYALHGAGLVSRPLNSTEFESWGEAGQGTWITSYASSGHSFMVVAGLRFDTGFNDSSSSGPKWSTRCARPTATSPATPRAVASSTRGRARPGALRRPSVAARQASKNSEISRPTTPTIIRIRPTVVISMPETVASTAK